MPGQVRMDRGVKLGRGAVGTEDLRADQLDLPQGETSPAAIALFHQLGARGTAHQLGQGGPEGGMTVLGTHAL